MQLQFYILATLADSRHYAGGQWMNDTRSRCHSCQAFASVASVSPPLEIALNSIGQQGFTEYLWNSHHLPLFRHDLIRLWQANQFRGFTLLPVHIAGWYQKPHLQFPQQIPSYSYLDTTSEVRLQEPAPETPPCPICGFIRYTFPKLGNHLAHGIEVDLQTWDGSDFFGLRGYRFLFCTHRVAEITLRGGFNRSISFVRLQDWQRWEDFDMAKWTSQSWKAHLESFQIRRVGDL